MFKRSFLVATLATLTSTAALAEGGAPAPRMSAEQIETYSTQSFDARGSSAGIVLPLVLLILMIIAATGGSGGGSYSYGHS